MGAYFTAGAVKVPLYNSPLFAVCGGRLYYGYPYGALTVCGNQGSAPLLSTVLTSMCFLNQTIYAVDGSNIATVPLSTLDYAPYPTIVDPGTPAAPAYPAPVYASNPLSSSATGSLAAQTYYVKATYTTASGETVASVEWSLAVLVDHVLVVASPPSVAYATSWNVYVSLASGTETLQQAGIAIGTSWTEPTTGLVATGATAPAGATPTNCFLCANWRGRFVLAGDANNPQNFYMSRVGVPTDWNYAATDPAAAVAGNLSESGQIGEPIVALIPYTDDYMLIGCTNSLWMLQGDPANGGSIVRVSDQMGLVSPNSWCIDPAGTLYFIARGGLYSVRPIWEFYQPPQLLSGETYDQYFQTIINGSYYISMQWDVDAKYMHIFATPTDGVTQGTHLIFDQRGGGLWPQQYQINQGPTATVRYAANNIVQNTSLLGGAQRAILLGGWDGFIRQWTTDYMSDDNNAITAYATLGPVKVNPEAAILSAITIDFGEVLTTDTEAQWSVDTLLAAGPDAYNVTEDPNGPHNFASIQSSLDRRQVTYRQRMRGGWFSIQLFNNTINTYFTFESALLEFIGAGRNREIR